MAGLPRTGSPATPILPEVPAACALVNHMYQRRAAVPGPAGYRLPGQARAVVATWSTGLTAGQKCWWRG